jgi:hypothetical protein
MISPAAAPDAKLLGELADMAAETVNGASGEEEGDKDCMAERTIAQENDGGRILREDGRRRILREDGPV